MGKTKTTAAKRRSDPIPSIEDAATGRRKIFKAKVMPPPPQKRTSGKYYPLLETMKVGEYFLLVSDEEIQRVRNAVSHFKKQKDKTKNFYVSRVMDQGPNSDRLACFRCK